MNIKPLFWIVAFALIVSVMGCQKQDTEQMTEMNVAETSTDESNIALDATTELALGTLKLEGTENAITPAQAGELLPLWQIIQGGSLKSAASR